MLLRALSLLETSRSNRGLRIQTEVSKSRIGRNTAAGPRVASRLFNLLFQAIRIIHKAPCLRHLSHPERLGGRAFTVNDRVLDKGLLTGF